MSEITRLRARVAEAEETLRAIRSGEVDAVMVAGKRGVRVFTLEGAEHAYRVLIETMNEGALTLTTDKSILYANRCFAGMVKTPLEQVIGGSFRRFLGTNDRAALRVLLQRGKRSGAKLDAQLIAGDGSKLPVHISIRPLTGDRSIGDAVGMVVTNMSEAQRNEDLLRALSRGLVGAQEAERGRVALELHDHVTQLLCAVAIHSQTLANGLPAGDERSKEAAAKLGTMLGETADAVERISRNLRPSVLDQMGLAAVLRATGEEFSARTGVPLTLDRVRLTGRLAPEIELTLYRILQEALSNVEKHARARRVTVRLRRTRAFVQLVIQDDGVGFDSNRKGVAGGKKRNLGLLGMHERATYVGGTLEIASKRGAGTKVAVRVPTTPPSRQV